MKSNTNNPMELDELLKKKEQTQQAISKLLDAFEKETGVSRFSIDINRVEFRTEVGTVVATERKVYFNLHL